MNTGPVVARYSRALLKMVTENGRGAEVYSSVKNILETKSLPKEGLPEEVSSLVRLLIKNHRENLLKDILRVFLGMYRDSNGLKEALVTTAVAAPGFEKRLKAMLESKTGCSVNLSTKVDPSIVGGFVLTLDDLELDGSVKHQLEQLRREFVEKN